METNPNNPSMPDYRRIHPLTRDAQKEITHWLYQMGELTEWQRDFSSVIPITNDSMAPQLRTGGLVVTCPLGPQDYQTLTGKVVAILLETQGPDADSDQYAIGRLKVITHDYIYLGFDNAEFGNQSISRKQAISVSEVLQVLGTPVR